jgi:hypothetical protein
VSNKKRARSAGAYGRRRRSAPATDKSSTLVANKASAAAKPSAGKAAVAPKPAPTRARRKAPGAAAAPAEVPVSGATSTTLEAPAPAAELAPETTAEEHAPGVEEHSPASVPLEEAAAPDASASEEQPPAPPTDAAPTSGSRVRRSRTRTLADVPQPEYPAAPEDEAPVAPAEPERRPERSSPPGLPRVPGTTGPLSAGVTMPPRAALPSLPRMPASTAPLAPAPRAAPSGPLGPTPSGSHPSAPSTPHQRPRVTDAPPVADQPLPTVPFVRQPIPRPARGPLSGPRSGHQEAAQAAETAEAAPASSAVVPRATAASAPLAPRPPWSIQQGSPRLVLTAALGHVFVGIGLAVATAVVFLVSAEQGYRLLAIAAVIIVGGLAGHVLTSTDRPNWAGALAMVVAQLITLALFLSIIGAQVAVLLFVPGAVYLAQRMGGRVVAIISGAGAVITYLAFVIAGLIWPAPNIHPTALLFFNLFAAVAGTGLLMAALLEAAIARERSEAAARARLYELRMLRARTAEARERTERDARMLEEALANALRGRGIEPVSTEGALSPVAELANDVADRLATLQKDREDRLRIEGAVRAVVRAVERGWHGLPWAWPEPSGTLLDQLIAYLRTPRPHEPGTPNPWGDERPTIVPKAARGTDSRPLEPRSDPDIASVFSAVDEQWDPWSER